MFTEKQGGKRGIKIQMLTILNMTFRWGDGCDAAKMNKIVTTFYKHIFQIKYISRPGGLVV